MKPSLMTILLMVALCSCRHSGELGVDPETRIEEKEAEIAKLVGIIKHYEQGNRDLAEAIRTIQKTEPKSSPVTKTRYFDTDEYSRALDTTIRMLRKRIQYLHSQREELKNSTRGPY